ALAMPDTSKFTALEEAVGLRQPEPVVEASPAVSPISSDLKEIGPAKMDDGHYIDLAGMAAGEKIGSSTSLLDRADL
ncbi:hypothetical protein ABTI15_20670, partial [Acinetobacter baumannii]